MLASDGTLLDVHERVPNREQSGRLLKSLRIHGAQAAEIVENVETAAEGCRNQIALLFLYRQIAHRNGRHAAFELRPAPASVNGEKKTKLRPHEKELRIHWIFRDGKHHAVLRQIAGDRVPAMTVVAALEQVRFEVAHLVIVKAGVDGIRIVLGGQQAAHVGQIGNARKLVVASPVRRRRRWSPE